MGKLDKEELQLEDSEISDENLVNASASFNDPDGARDAQPMQISSNVRNSTLLEGDQDSSSAAPQLIPMD